MLTPQINFKGLGVHLTGAEKPEAFWHAGNNAGFVGLLYGITDKGQGAVVLTNSDTGEELALQIMTSIANSYNWPVMKTYLSRKLTTEEISSYKGNYQSKVGTTITIGENEDGLFLIPHLPKKEIPMYKISDNQFTLKDSPDFVTISFDKENGITTGIVIAQKLGKVDRLKKVE